jgi:C4-type Zn-finger protein
MKEEIKNIILKNEIDNEKEIRIKEEMECPICFEENINKKEDVVLCPYSTNSKEEYTHGFCIECIESLLENTTEANIKCPICRRNIKSILKDKRSFFEKTKYKILVIPIFFLPPYILGRLMGLPKNALGKK